MSRTRASNSLKEMRTVEYCRGRDWGRHFWICNSESCLRWSSQTGRSFDIGSHDKIYEKGDTTHLSWIQAGMPDRPRRRGRLQEDILTILSSGWWVTSIHQSSSRSKDIKLKNKNKKESSNLLTSLLQFIYFLANLFQY